jgi:hypothetical protein
MGGMNYRRLDPHPFERWMNLLDRMSKPPVISILTDRSYDGLMSTDEKSRCEMKLQSLARVL